MKNSLDPSLTSNDLSQTDSPLFERGAGGVKGFVGFLAVILVSLPIFAQRLPETIIKVGIVQNSAASNITCEGDYYIYEMNTGSQTRIKPLDDYLIKANGNKIIFNGKVVSSPARVVSKSDNASISINGRRYRDNVIIRATDGKLTIINEIGLEDYLRGVLPVEIDKN